jgi:hypothetical protein
MSDIGFDQPPNGSNGGSNGNGPHFAGYTGRFIVTFEPSAADAAAAILHDKAGLQTLSARSLGDEAPGERNVVLEEIATAVVDAPPDQQRALQAAVADNDVPILKVEPERMNWALAMPPPIAVRGGIPARALRSRRADASLASPPDDSASFTGPAFADAARDGVSAEFLRGYAAAVNGLVASLGRAPTTSSTSFRRSPA